MAVSAIANLIISILSLCIFCQQMEVTGSDPQISNEVRSADRDLEKSTLLKDSKSKFVVCYFASWTTRENGVAKLLPENIDPKMCTHINYAFAILSNETLEMVPNSPYIDIELKTYDRIIKLKEKNEDMKVLLSLGGWADSKSDKYSRMISEPEKRTKFAKEAVNFLHQHGFDGLDVDWEFPVCWQADCSRGNASDKKNFVYLAQELREAFDEASPALLLTVALSGSEYFAEQAYDIAALAKYVDFFNVMSYNFHGSWEKTTGHGSEMHGHRVSDVGVHSAASVMEYFVKKGSPREKLMMGIPLFGRTFTLENPNNNGIGAPSTGSGRPGIYSKESGLLAYYEICDLIKNSNWTVRRDKAAGPYAFHNNQWVGYDDPISAKEKALIILKKGYGGAVVWELSLDDRRGTCHMRTFPIVRELQMNLLPNTIKNKANGSFNITDKYKEIILFIAAFMILQAQQNFYVVMD